MTSPTNPILAMLEDLCLRSRLIGMIHIRFFHTGNVLASTGNTACDVKRRTHGLTGLSDLNVFFPHSRHLLRHEKPPVHRLILRQPLLLDPGSLRPAACCHKNIRFRNIYAFHHFFSITSFTTTCGCVDWNFGSNITTSPFLCLDPVHPWRIRLDESLPSADAYPDKRSYRTDFRRK